MSALLRLSDANERANRCAAAWRGESTLQPSITTPNHPSLASIVHFAQAWKDARLLENVYLLIILPQFLFAVSLDNQYLLL